MIHFPGDGCLKGEQHKGFCERNEVDAAAGRVLKESILNFESLPDQAARLKRNAYQREYQRKRREEKKENRGS